MADRPQRFTAAWLDALSHVHHVAAHVDLESPSFIHSPLCLPCCLQLALHSLSRSLAARGSRRHCRQSALAMADELELSHRHCPWPPRLPSPSRERQSPHRRTAYPSAPSQPQSSPEAAAAPPRPRVRVWPSHLGLPPAQPSSPMDACGPTDFHAALLLGPPPPALACRGWPRSQPPAHVAGRPWATSGGATTGFGCASTPRSSSAASSPPSGPSRPTSRVPDDPPPPPL